jgi:hypothetical protein
VVKERKVAITGVSIRASCRRFRMSGFFAPGRSEIHLCQCLPGT